MNDLSINFKGENVDTVLVNRVTSLVTQRIKIITQGTTLLIYSLRDTMSSVYGFHILI